MNVSKTKVIRISKQSITIRIMTHHKQLKNVVYLNYVASIRMM